MAIPQNNTQNVVTLTEVTLNDVVVTNITGIELVDDDPLGLEQFMFRIKARTARCFASVWPAARHCHWGR